MSYAWKITKQDDANPLVDLSSTDFAIGCESRKTLNHSSFIQSSVHLFSGADKNHNCCGLNHLYAGKKSLDNDLLISSILLRLAILQSPSQVPRSVYFISQAQSTNMMFLVTLNHLRIKCSENQSIFFD